MPRVLSPTNSISGPLSDGQRVIGDFADLDKPIDGEWTLTVNLSKTATAPSPP
jgi:hypothetical protein